MGKRTRKKPDPKELIDNLYDDLIKHYQELIMELEEELKNSPGKPEVKRYLEKIKNQLKDTQEDKEGLKNK